MNKPDYKNSITNFSNSILSHFGVKPFHNTIKEIDERIKGKKKIICFLFDGMGTAILNKHLKEDSFFRSHVVHRMSSTLPPTTVASTTSLLSGKYPIETGWLGWTLYFKDINRNINVFKNKDDQTGEKLPGEYVMKKKCPYKDIAQLINEQNKKDIAEIILGYPVDEDNKKVRHLKSFVRYSFDEINKPEKEFVYSYWVTPDMYMHRLGTNSLIVHLNIKRIQRYIKHFSRKNPDVTILVIADHGMKDVKFVNMGKHPDLVETFVRPSSMEKRSMNFFIKEDKKEQFEALFNKYYGDHYVLMKREEVLKENLLGDASPSKEALEFLGDYVAFATDEISLMWTEQLDDKSKFKAHHAGTTKEEFEISVIAIN